MSYRLAEAVKTSAGATVPAAIDARPGGCTLFPSVPSGRLDP